MSACWSKKQAKNCFASGKTTLIIFNLKINCFKVYDGNNIIPKLPQQLVGKLVLNIKTTFSKNAKQSLFSFVD